MIEEKFQKKLGSGKEKLLSIGGSLYFGGGGVVIQNLDIQNKCLLSKWLFKLINEDGIGQNLLKKKYLSNKTLTQVKQQQPGDSHFCPGLIFGMWAFSSQ
jgi:hypothetical protein